MMNESGDIKLSESCAFSDIYVDENDIVRLRVKSKGNVELKDAEEAFSCAQGLVSDRPLSILVDTTQLKTMTLEARKYFASKEVSSYTNACAVLVGSYVTKTLANVFIHVSRPGYPFEFFTDQNSAIAWLIGKQNG